MNDKELREISQRVIDALTPDLIKPEYRRDDCPVAGAGYIVSEAIYYLGGRELGYRPVRAKLFGVTHWWLSKDGGTGDHEDDPIIDMTPGQFTSDKLFMYYAAGRRGGFLTNKPSKRAAELIRRVAAQKTYKTCRGTCKVKVPVDAARILQG